MGRSSLAVGLLIASIGVVSCSGGQKPAPRDGLSTELVEKRFELTSEVSIPGGFAVGFPLTALKLSDYSLPEGISDGLLHDLKWYEAVGQIGTNGDVAKPNPFVALRSKRDFWVDWNRDKTFSPEEKQVVAGTFNGATYFEPTGAPRDTRSPKTFFKYAGANDHAKGSTEKWILVVPAVYFEGTVQLGGKKVGLKLVDGNFDGQLGDSKESVTSGDSLAIDFNLDGIVVPQGAWHGGAVGETVPLRSTHLFPDNKYYVLEFSPDGKSLNLTPDPTPTGQVRLDLDVEGLVSVSQGMDFQYVPVIDGHITLRSGTYEISGLSYAVKDESGGKWNLSMDQPRSRYFTIGKGTSESITSNPPYSAASKVLPQAGKQIVNLWIYDKEGNVILPVEGPEMPFAMPQCTISNSAGKVVHQGNMQYWGGNYVLVWDPPKGASGIFNIGIRWDLSLWGSVQTTTRFRL